MVASGRVDGARLWTSLEQVSSFGGTPDGGLHRLGASEEDGRARDLVLSRARSLGCDIRVDPVGNAFATLRGAEQGTRPVLMGSHLDSQPRACRYDGVYGVMAGLEVLTALAAAGERTRRGAALAIWTNEEGARFAPAMMGSAVFAGRLARDQALGARDADGVDLATALARIGYAGTDEVAPADFSAYVEAHIEQGPTLEDAGVPIGVVTGAQGQVWLEVELLGSRGHAGTFPWRVARTPSSLRPTSWQPCDASACVDRASAGPPWVG